MNIDRRLLRKADPLLRDELERARGEEVLRAVLLLRPDGAIEGPAAPDPRDFDSREAYRRALIEARRRAIAGEVGETRRALEGLGLSPRGAELGRTVVVEGPAARILEAMGLPGVDHASLDRPIASIAPRRPDDRPRSRRPSGHVRPGSLGPRGRGRR